MTRKFKSLEAFYNALREDKEFKKEFQKNPYSILESAVEIVPKNDKWIYRIIMISLGITLITVVISALIITSDPDNANNPIPTIFSSTASIAIGAMVGLLAPSPNSES